MATMADASTNIMRPPAKFVIKMPYLLPDQWPAGSAPAPEASGADPGGGIASSRATQLVLQGRPGTASVLFIAFASR